jgi:hypothetical protein
MQGEESIHQGKQAAQNIDRLNVKTHIEHIFTDDAKAKYNGDTCPAHGY